MQRSSKKAPAIVEPPTDKKKNIIFFHPDLGIGGAERLIIDAAIGLQQLGHKITIFTSHRDVNHCFDEAQDGTLDVRVRGNTLIPATVLGRFKILCSILRQIHLLYLITRNGELAKLDPSVFFIDQLSAGIPFLRWFWEDIHILFYCHFPDLLLVQNRKSWHKRIWRLPFDWLEGWSIRGADKVVVNSGFTKGVVEGIWPGLGDAQGVSIIYPCVDTQKKKKAEDGNNITDQGMWKGKRILLSINRFEKKKGVALALRAFGGLTPQERATTRLVIAGGYDARVHENAAYLKELESLAASLKLKAATAKNIVSAQAIPNDIETLFLLSFPDRLKDSLLQAAKVLIYTPSNEHFGIVPLEAMLASVPVLAADSGGPLETIVDGETGWLRSPTEASQWTDVLRKVIAPKDDQLLQEMGEKGKKRVLDNFSKTKMSQRFGEELDATIKGARPQATELGDVAIAFLFYMIALGVIGLVIREGTSPQLRGTTNKPRDYAMGGGLIGLSLLGCVGITWKLMQNESAFM